MFFWAVAVSWLMVTDVVPSDASVSVTPGNALATTLVLLYWVGVVTPFWVMVYWAGVPTVLTLPAVMPTAARKLPEVSDNAISWAPVPRLSMVILSVVGS